MKNTNGVATFEKVSKEQFTKTMNECGFTFAERDIDHIYDNIILPTRATRGSAGYDIHTPIGFEVKAGESIMIPTGLRCKITDGWFLGVVPKSGLGCKFGMRLSNTFGVVDSDYYYSDNEGHIMVKFSVDKDKYFGAGDKLCQGIFLCYGTTFDDNTEGVRNGGFGSTGE